VINGGYRVENTDRIDGDETDEKDGEKTIADRDWMVSV
jgi:hypothetical protein